MTVPPITDTALARIESKAMQALSTARSLVFLSTLAAVLSFIAILRTC